MESDPVLIATIAFLSGALVGGLVTAGLMQIRAKYRDRWHDYYRPYVVKERQVRPFIIDSAYYRTNRRSWWSFLRFFQRSHNDWDTVRYRGTPDLPKVDWYTISRAELRSPGYSHKPSFKDRLSNLFRKNNRW